MNSQSFANHVRVHPLYHYLTIPISLALVPLALINVWLHPNLESVIILLSMIVLHIAIFLTRDYAKRNQDRIIRSELRLRYFQLTGKRLDELEDLLSLGQLLALRFTNDEEFLEMIHNPETKEKKPEDIKRQIIQWNADWMRV
jgi:hypothetical protein